MVKKLLLLLLFSDFYSSQGQTNVYHPLPNDSLVWLQSWQDSFGGMNYYVNEMSGDTIIGAYAYKKIYASGMWVTPVYTPPVPLYYQEAIRQDIAAKRIYTMNTLGVETLTYDFNKIAGDTLVILQDPIEDTLYVSSIDSMLVQGQYHRMLHVLNSASSHTGFHASDWVEGIGSLAGFNHYYLTEFEAGYNLLCYSHNNLRLYPPGPSATQCTISVGIVETGKNNFKISVMPNPVADAVNIQISCHEHYSAELSDAFGKKLLQKNDQSAMEQTFDLESYPAGVYYLRISDAKGNAAVKKIVKQ